MRAIPVAIPRIITALIPHLRYRCGSSSARARLQKMTAVCPDMKEQSQSHWLEMTIGEVKFLFPAEFDNLIRTGASPESFENSVND